MGFSLYKGGPTSTVPTERYIASGAIAEGMPVALAAGASGAELGKVVQLSGGSAASEILYGVAIHAAADGAEVLVQPADGSSIWVVDAAADTNVSSVAQDNYLTSTSLTLTVGASTVNGRKCAIVGQLGVTGDRKYLVRFDLTSRSDAFGVALAGRPFRKTVTLTAAAAGTPVAIVAASALNPTDKIFITDFLVSVGGTTAWADATATIVTLQDTAASPVVAATFAKAQLTSQAQLGKHSTGVTLATPVRTGVGLTAAKGLSVAGDANFGAGSDLSVTVVGYIASA